MLHCLKQRIIDISKKLQLRHNYSGHKLRLLITESFTFASLHPHTGTEPLSDKIMIIKKLITYTHKNNKK